MRGLSPTQHSFKWMDAVVLGFIFLGCLVMGLTHLGRGSAGMKKTVCASNMQLIVAAHSRFAADHAYVFSWGVPSTQGGAYGSSDAWRIWLTLSNHLDHPRVFACPSDATRTPSAGWSAFASTEKDLVISYGPVVEARQDIPEMPLLVDRNYRSNMEGSQCGFAGGTYSQLSGNQSVFGWFSENIHRTGGNVAYPNGYATFTDSRGLRKVLINAWDDSSAHICRPVDNAVGERIGNN